MECRHHPRCPGCPLLSLSYPEQLLAKQQRLAAAFARYPHLPPAPVVQPAQFTADYRHRLKLPVTGSGAKLRIGLQGRQGGEVVDTPDCPVLTPGLRDTLQAMRPWLAERRGIHAIDLRQSALTGKQQLILACVGGDLHGGKRGARELLRQIPALASVSVSVADPEGKRVMGSRPQVLAGAATLEEGIGETRYHLYPGAFFQIDPRNAAWIHERVAAGVGDAQRVLDLYAGVGAYARMLAPGRVSVTAVEEVPQAARAAGLDAPPNLTVLQGRVEDVPLDTRADAVVINPARRGSLPGVLQRLSRITGRLVYVSCGPESLARDLDCLAAHGLRVRSVAAVDLFPQTAEVEAVVTLERGSPLKAWGVTGGQATGPWFDRPSGALGRPSEVVALLIGRTPEHLDVAGARLHRLGEVASHSLVRIQTESPVIPVLAALARQGHPVAGRDSRTARFFAEKAGLVRPFVHVARAGKARAPLHGDLVAALEALGAPDRLIARAGGGERADRQPRA